MISILQLDRGALCRCERRLRVDVLARQLGIAPHVARGAGEARDHPGLVGGDRRDEGDADRPRLVVVRDAVLTTLERCAGMGQ
jgi:hypothetical protein